ncbi:MAG: diguanylate cyclase [Anaerosomatales bacterium]|nr:diguanylate cyclase [Anaerosomatales bacterium]
MKYTRFEKFVIVLGAAVVVASVIVPRNVAPQWPELVAQALLFLTFAAAAHWGRNGGSVVATASALAYVLTRVPMLASQGLTNDLAGALLARLLAFAIVGIVGGEVFGRIKYFLARVDGSVMLDEYTQVYNRKYCSQALRNAIGQYQRYQTPYSVALLSLAPALFAELRPTRQHSILKSVANHIRSDIRLVDDVGYLGDGRFLLMFPNTPKSGAEIAADRVRAGVRDLVGAKDGSVSTTVLSVAEDGAAICELARSLEPQTPPRLDDVCAGVQDEG